MKKSIQVKLDDKTVEVSKLPIGRYAELLKALKELPIDINGIEKLSNDQIFKQLPTMIGDALPQFLNILPIATPLKIEEIEPLGLDEVVRLVMAVVEVNNYSEVFSTVKKALARPAQIAPKN